MKKVNEKNREVRFGEKEEKLIRRIGRRYSISPDKVCSYLNKKEKVVGFGRGGSESMVLFLKSGRKKEIIIRKIVSKKLVTARWGDKGRGVMLPPTKKALSQIEYINNLPSEVRKYFPDICNIKKNTKKDGVVYDQSYVPGLEVSSFIAQYKPSPKLVAHLYREILLCLKENVFIHRKISRGNIKTLEVSYFNKIKERLSLAQKTAPKLFSEQLLDSDYIYINNKKYLNLSNVCEKIKNHRYCKVLEPSSFCLVVGDTNTENIKISNIDPLLEAMKTNTFNFKYSDIKLKFLDPRAIGFRTVGKNTVDDYMYDNKPLHNSLGNYDVIHNEYFDLFMNFKKNIPNIEIHHFENHPFKKSYCGVENFFGFIMEGGWNVNSKEALRQDPYWLIRFAFVMGTHFAAMSPFHFHKNEQGVLMDNYICQKRPISIYCEGVKWLNHALRMLNKELDTFYGVTVPCKFPD